MIAREAIIADGASSISQIATETLLEDKSKLLGIFPRNPDEKTKDAIATAAAIYVRLYLQRYGTLNLLGSPDTVGLESLYVETRVWETLPSGSTDAIAEANLGSESIHKAAIETVHEHQYLMVYGIPGSGKSVFLAKLGLDVLRGQRLGGLLHSSYIPAFVDRKALTGAEGEIEKAIVDGFRHCGFPSADRLARGAIAQGRLLILFDDLHKIPTFLQEEAIANLENFIQKYPKNRYVASCRTGLFRHRWHTFKSVAIAGLDDDRIQQLTRSWFHSSAANTDCSDLFLGALQQPENAAAKTLAQTPLFLTLLCLVYERSQTLPANRAVLYLQASHILLEAAGEISPPPGVSTSPEMNRELAKLWISQLAFRSILAERFEILGAELSTRIPVHLLDLHKDDYFPFSIPANVHADATESANKNSPKLSPTDKSLSVPVPVNPSTKSAKPENKNQALAFAPSFGENRQRVEKMLHAIALRSGILTQVAPGCFAFSHLTLQEYFTAIYVDTYYLAAQISAKTLTLKRWQEVFLFVSGIRYPTADKLLLLMEAAAQKYIKTSKLRSLLRWASEVISEDSDPLKPAAKRTAVLFLVLALNSALAPHSANLESDSPPELTRDLDLMDDSLLADRALTCALDLAKILDLDLERPISRARILAHDFIKNLSFACSRPLDVERSASQLTRELAKKLARDRARQVVLDLERLLECEGDFSLDRTKDLAFVSILTRSIEELGIFNNMEEAIAGLQALQTEIPDTNASYEVHYEFRDRIRQTWLSALNLRSDLVKLSLDERQALADYFYAHWLICRTYNAAVSVTPATWKVIEGRMVKGS